MIPYGKQAVVAAVSNITGRKKAEATLRQSEDSYRLLFETIPQGIDELDTNGMITAANQAFHELHGYKNGELIGAHITDLFTHESDKIKFFEDLDRYVSGEIDPGTLYIKHCRKDGKIIETEVNWNYKCNEKGEIIGYVTVMSDITERKRTQDALIVSQERLERALDASELGMWDYTVRKWTN